MSSTDPSWMPRLKQAFHAFGHKFLTADAHTSDPTDAKKPTSGYVNRKVAWAAGLGWLVGRPIVSGFRGTHVKFSSLVFESLVAAAVAIPISWIPTLGEGPGTWEFFNWLRLPLTPPPASGGTP